MADKSRQSNPNLTATDHNLGSHPEGINPSAPSVGTAGWGTTSDERDAVSSKDPDATRAGQMKGNLGDDMTSASQRMSDEATTNKRRSEDSKDDQRRSVESHQREQPLDEYKSGRNAPYLPLRRCWKCQLLLGNRRTHGR